MDAESLAQIQQLLTGATQGIRQEISSKVETFSETISESKRHTGVLIEELHHKLELVIEGQQFIRQEIVDVRSEIQHESRETRALLQLSYHQLQERVEKLERRVHAIEHHLGIGP